MTSEQKRSPGTREAELIHAELGKGSQTTCGEREVTAKDLVCSWSGQRHAGARATWPRAPWTGSARGQGLACHFPVLWPRLAQARGVPAHRPCRGLNGGAPTKDRTLFQTL